MTGIPRADLDVFVAGGGNFIDTADLYSVWGDGLQGGESEKLIIATEAPGQFLCAHIVHLPFNFCSGSGNASFIAAGLSGGRSCQPMVAQHT